MEYEHESASLKYKLKSTICFSCCFGHDENLDSSLSTHRLTRSSSTWLKSTTRDLPEIKEKCRNLFSRIGRSRRNSVEFKYDPLSYALNFDEGCDDEFPLRSFSTRLPESPPPKSVAAAPVIARREIVACS